MNRVHPWVVVAGALVLAGCSPFGSDDSSSVDDETAVGADDIYSIGIDGSDRKDITRTPSASEWGISTSPDGSRIAFIRGRLAGDSRGRLYVMDADGGGERDLGSAAPGPEVAEPHPPAWSPDAHRIAVTNPVGCGDVLCDYRELWVVDVASGARRRIAREGSDPAWSPDGRRIAYVRYVVGGDVEPEFKATLVVARADGSAARAIARNAGSPAWSPRGDLIAYLGPGGDLVVASPDGSEPRLIAKRVGSRPVWSPRGERLAFTGSSVPSSLFVVGADGRGLRRIAEVGGEHTVAWSPRGDRLAWLARVGLTPPGRISIELVVGTPDGYGGRTIAAEPYGSSIDALAWSADGERVYYSAFRAR